MTIRPISAQDAATIANLVVASATTVSTDFSQDGWEFFLSSNTTQATLERINDERYLMLCLQQKQRILGMISMYDFTKIDQLFVLPGFSGQGIAKQLWTQARSICEQAVKQNSFWVRSSSSAESIYHKFGFVSVGQREIRNGISFQFMAFPPPNAGD